MLLQNTINSKCNVEKEKIYKFVPLYDDFEKMPKEQNLMDVLNEKKGSCLDYKRIYDLVNKKCWFSKYELLNDPFELENIAYEKNKYIGMGACQNLNSFMNKRCVAIASFTCEFNIMPMWAHYANNHKGFCIEFEIKSQKCIFPVLYQEERTKEYVYSPLTARNEKELEYLGLQLSIKAKDWEYEKELRMIACESSGIESNGLELGFNEIGICAKRIIVGANCNSNNKYILKRSAQILGIDCCQAIISNKKFEIFTRKMRKL